MARAIFTTQTPGFPDESDGAPGLTLGTVFSTSVGITCDGIWWYFPATLPGGTVTAHLYDESDQTELATATFSAPVAGTWNLATFASPVTLSAGNNYVACVWTPDRYVATGNLFGSAIINGDFTAPADEAGLRNGRFVVNAAPTYPTGSFGANGYLVDVDIPDATITIEVGQASEVDTAGSATPSRTVAVGRAAEADTAGATTPSRTVPIGRASETDTAHAVAVTGGAQRDLDLTLGRPEPKWHVGQARAKWTVGRPEV